MNWDEEMSVRRCAGCEHPKIFHRENDGPCFGHPTKKNHSSGLSDDHENVEARKQLGFECWCPAFTDDPKRAAEIILKHGNGAALRRGIDEAIDRKEWESAKRLRTRLLRETPKQERDDLWLADVDRQLSALRKGETAANISNGLKQDPELWAGLRQQFEDLADAEVQRDPENRRNRWLRVFASNGEGDDFGRVVYHLSEGMDERFKDAFLRNAKKAGTSLGLGTNTDALDSWLSYVFAECRDHKSKYLRCDNGEEAVIARICEASALCCSRLEQHCFEKCPPRITSASPALAMRKTARGRSVRPKSSQERKRQTVIFSAIEARLTGSKYCSHLDSRRLLASEEWRDQGWPGSYSQAYRQSKNWRKRIQDEKCRFRAKYEQLSPAERRAIIEGAPSARATRR